MIFKKVNLSEALVEAVTFGPEVAELIKQQKWGDALEKTMTDEEANTLVSMFLDSYGPFKSYPDKIEAIKEPLIAQIRRMGRDGFVTELNPFLTFINNYFSRGGDLTADQYRIVNNLYAKGLIDRNDLLNNDASNNLLLNHDLYNKSDAEFIMKTYKFLSKPQNIKKYINKEGEPEEIRNEIIFTDSNPSSNIKNPEDIKVDLLKIQKPDIGDTGTIEIKKVDYTQDEINQLVRKVFEKGAWDNFKPKDINLLLNYWRDKEII